MNKLSKEQLKTKLAFEQALCSAKNVIDTAIEKYNELLVDVESFRDEVRGSMEDFVGEKSEKWLNSENGQAFTQWMELWEDQFDPIEELDLDHHDKLCNLPEDVDEM